VIGGAARLPASGAAQPCHPPSIIAEIAELKTDPHAGLKLTRQNGVVIIRAMSGQAFYFTEPSSEDFAGSGDSHFFQFFASCIRRIGAVFLVLRAIKKGRIVQDNAPFIWEA
jgi:acetoin utilization deacetylase AcuC-like enzyme